MMNIENTKTAIGSNKETLGLAIVAALFVSAVTATPARAAETIPGVRFTTQADTVYAPVRALAESLGWPIHWDGDTETLYLKDQKIPPSERRSLPDGTQVVPIRRLTHYGAAVRWNGDEQTATVEHGDKAVSVPAGRVSVLSGVTFAGSLGTLYAPVRALGEAVGKPIRWEAKTGKIFWNNRPVAEGALRALPDGTQMIVLDSLKGPEGVTVAWHGTHEAARVDSDENGRSAWVRKGDKRVAVSIDAQQMRAWQGDLLVLDTRVSTGRPSMATPKGRFTAGPLKTPLIISEEYNNARMPWSVQVRGDVVIHGYPSVPARAASHGCVRVPLTGANPAKWFYRWVEVGTPIEIHDGWPDDASAA